MLRVLTGQTFQKILEQGERLHHCTISQSCQTENVWLPLETKKNVDWKSQRREGEVIKLTISILSSCVAFRKSIIMIRILVDHLTLLLRPLYEFPSVMSPLCAPSDVPHFVIFRGHPLIWIQNENYFSFSIVFRHITLRSLKAYWMNSCSDLMPSQTACTTLCPPKLVTTGKTVLTHLRQLTWTHRSTIRKILCFKHERCVFWKVSAVWTLWFCSRTLSEQNCQTRQWWVKQMSLPVKILYLLLTYHSNFFFRTCSGCWTSFTKY